MADAPAKKRPFDDEAIWPQIVNRLAWNAAQNGGRLTPDDYGRLLEMGFVPLGGQGANASGLPGEVLSRHGAGEGDAALAERMEILRTHADYAAGMAALIEADPASLDPASNPAYASLLRRVAPLLDGGSIEQKHAYLVLRLTLLQRSLVSGRNAAHAAAEYRRHCRRLMDAMGQIGGPGRGAGQQGAHAFDGILREARPAERGQVYYYVPLRDKDGRPLLSPNGDLVFQPRRLAPPAERFGMIMVRFLREGNAGTALALLFRDTVREALAGRGLMPPVGDPHPAAGGKGQPSETADPDLIGAARMARRVATMDVAHTHQSGERFSRATRAAARGAPAGPGLPGPAPALAAGPARARAARPSAPPAPRGPTIDVGAGTPPGPFDLNPEFLGEGYHPMADAHFDDLAEHGGEDFHPEELERIGGGAAPGDGRGR